MPLVNSNDIFGWTWGAEHEWADWPMKAELPTGYKRDVRDITIMNSNGIANDPTGRSYEFGGEINTPPTTSRTRQVWCMRLLKKQFPMATVNHRSNLHLHIRVPGLRDDLKALKQVQRYIHTNMRTFLQLVEPLPKPTIRDRVDQIDIKRYSDQTWLAGAQRRWRRRKVSHQALLTPGRLEHQLEATTVEEFFRREPPQSKVGKPLWHLQPRLCVNLRQHQETDTIEFRHFPGTLDEYELRACLDWVTDFTYAALHDWHPVKLLREYEPAPFPKFPPYVHWREERYRATVHDGTVNKDVIAHNIQLILKNGDPK